MKYPSHYDFQRLHGQMPIPPSRFIPHMVYHKYTDGQSLPSLLLMFTWFPVDSVDWKYNFPKAHPKLKLLIKPFSNSPFFNYVMNTFIMFTMCYSLFHTLNPPANMSQIPSHPHFIDIQTQIQKVKLLVRGNATFLL